MSEAFNPRKKMLRVMGVPSQWGVVGKGQWLRFMWSHRGGLTSLVIIVQIRFSVFSNRNLILSGTQN